MSSPARSSASDDDDDDGYYGPCLPPAIPPVLRAVLIGPVLPQQSEKPDDEDEESATIGPLPPGAGPDPHADHEPVVRRSQNDDRVKREEWMTVIPEKVEKKLGFKSVTSFSQKPVGPAVRTKEKTASDHPTISETDLKAVDERKRAASLLDSHQKQQKKAKSVVAPEKEERQPFDPEKDLQVHKLDSRQTQAIISNSKLLNTRFSSGPSKFL